MSDASIDKSRCHARMPMYNNTTSPTETMKYGNEQISVPILPGLKRRTPLSMAFGTPLYGQIRPAVRVSGSFSHAVIAERCHIFGPSPIFSLRIRLSTRLLYRHVHDRTDDDVSSRSPGHSEMVKCWSGSNSLAGRVVINSDKSRIAQHQNETLDKL